MDFINPLMLAGLAAVLVPLVVHLLNQARYRNVDWAAMMFLKSLEPRADHAARLKQWALLAIRGGSVGLLAFGMALPILQTPTSQRRKPGRTAAVFVLDRSSSMLFNDNGRPRIDLARDAIYQLLSPGFVRGDDLWLLTLGDGENRPVYESEPQVMARHVREVTSPSGVADVAKGLDAAAKLLAQSNAPNREIYVVTDHQASSWASVDDTFCRRWRQKGGQDPPRVMLVPVGSDEAGNVAIQSVRPVAEPLISGRAANLEVTVQNFAAAPRGTGTLVVTVTTPSGRSTLVRRESLNLPALSSVTRSIPVTFGDPGCYVATATIEVPGFTTDKTFNRSLDVISPIKVLILDGDAQESEFRKPSDFLTAALAPYHDPGRDSFITDVVSPDTWTQPDLSTYRVVMLANVASLTEPQRRSIEQFVFDGGGLVVMPGDQTRVEQLESQFPWLGASVSPTTQEETGATEIASLAPELTKGRFGGAGGENGAPVSVRRYFPASPKAGAKVLGRFGDGKPFVIETSVGRGRAMLMTTPVDLDWNALALSPSFLPMAQSLVADAAGGETQWREARWNVTTAERLTAQFDTALDPRNIRVDPPRNSVRPTPAISQSTGETQVVIASTETPGAYCISTKGKDADPSAIRFSVSTPPSEMDLTPLPLDRRAQIARQLAARWADPDVRPLPAVQDAQRSGWNLWLPCIGAVIGMGVVELTLMRRWAGGAA